MKKYRVNVSGREVGPISIDKVGQLYFEDKIDGESLCQNMSSGKWIRIKEDSELLNYLINYSPSNKTNVHDATRMKIEATKLKVSVEELVDEGPEEKEVTLEKFEENEFKFDKNEDLVLDIDYEKLEENYNKEHEIEVSEQIEEGPEEDILEKTVIVNPHKVSNDNELEKTVVLKKNMIENIRKEKVKEKLAEKEKAYAEVAEEEKFSSKGETVVIRSLTLEDNSRKREIAKIDSEFKALEKIAEQEEEIEDDKGESNFSKKKIKKKSKFFLPLIMCVLIYFMLFDEEEIKVTQKVSFKPVHSKIVFPKAYEFLDEVKSKALIQKGIDELSKQNYKSNLKAAVFFREALSHNMNSNVALEKLIYISGLNYSTSLDKVNSAKSMYQLIKYSSNKIYTSLDVVVGAIHFFRALGKKVAAKNIAENYLRISSVRDEKFSSIYLKILLETGDLSTASKVYESLLSLKEKKVNTYLALLSYHSFNEDFESEVAVIEEAVKRYPKSVPLLLERVRILFKNEEYKSSKNTLNRIENLNMEFSPIYYGRFLEYNGVLAAYLKKSEVAAKLFKLSLKFNDSESLRSMLSSLNVGGSSTTESLILESKIIALMNKAKSLRSELKWQDAFIKALDAVDLSDSYIPSHLLLSEIQIERGYYGPALKTLSTLKTKYPKSKKIRIKLIYAYLAALKTKEAFNEIKELDADGSFRNTPEYSLVVGHYYLKIKRVEQAIKNFEMALQKNPVDDQTFFELANIYTRYRKYKLAKKKLIQAISFDPQNVEYRILYARILYDLDGADITIGYLRDLLDNFPDHPLILSSIAIYYYRNGQLVEYDKYKREADRHLKKTAVLYEYLLKSALITEEREEIIKYAKELLKIRPGKLEVQLLLAKYLLEKGSFEEAEKGLLLVKSRLESYPKVNFLLAKIAFDKGNYKDAVNFSNTEIKNNPSLPEGHYIKAEALRLSESFRAAIKSYEQSLIINPKYLPSLLGLSKIRMSENNFEEARDLLTRAKRIDPDNAEVYKELGNVYRKTGQNSLAIESYKVYIEMMPLAKDKQKIEQIIKFLK